MSRCSATSAYPDFPYTPACKYAFSKRAALLRAVGVTDQDASPADVLLSSPEELKAQDLRTTRKLDAVAATLKP
jgi:hypothetical protein